MSTSGRIGYVHCGRVGHGHLKWGIGHVHLRLVEMFLGVPIVVLSDHLSETVGKLSPVVQGGDVRVECKVTVTPYTHW